MRGNMTPPPYTIDVLRQLAPFCYVDLRIENRTKCRLSCQSGEWNLLTACSVYIIFSSWYILWYHESCPIVHPEHFLFPYHGPNVAF